MQPSIESCKTVGQFLHPYCATNHVSRLGALWKYIGSQATCKTRFFEVSQCLQPRESDEKHPKLKDLSCFQPWERLDLFWKTTKNLHLLDVSPQARIVCTLCGRAMADVFVFFCLRFCLLCSKQTGLLVVFAIPPIVRP